MAIGTLGAATACRVTNSVTDFYYGDAIMRQDERTRTSRTSRGNMARQTSLSPLSRALQLPCALACSAELANALPPTNTSNGTTQGTTSHTSQAKQVIRCSPISTLTFLISANAHSARPCSCATDKSASTRYALRHAGHTCTHPHTLHSNTQHVLRLQLQCNASRL